MYAQAVARPKRESIVDDDALESASRVGVMVDLALQVSNARPENKPSGTG
jgi:hypothetical protein